MRLPLNRGWLRVRDEPAENREEVGAPGISAARLALRAHLQATREPRHANRARETVRALCDDAHRRHLRAEQLLVAIKGAWRSLPEVQAAGRVAPQDSSLDRFISICIEEFYARRD